MTTNLVMEEDSHYFYLIEEYLEGNSLYDLIKDQGPFQERDAVRYGRQICSVVEYLHHSCDKPILHLDLQPKNLMLWTVPVYKKNGMGPQAVQHLNYILLTSL